MLKAMCENYNVSLNIGESNEKGAVLIDLALILASSYLVITDENESPFGDKYVGYSKEKFIQEIEAIFKIATKNRDHHNFTNNDSISQDDTISQENILLMQIASKFLQ